MTARRTSNNFSIRTVAAVDTNKLSLAVNNLPGRT